MAKTAILSFLLRGGAAGAKFLFVLYLARAASSSTVGEIAILMTIAAVFGQLAGLEIHQVIGRQLHGLTDAQRVEVIRKQSLAVLAAYVLLTPVLLFLYWDVLKGFWLYAAGILILEHFILEVYRYNIIMLKPVYASSLLFVKQAGWMILFIALVETGAAFPSLELAVYCWFGVLALMAIPFLLSAHTLPTLAKLIAPWKWLPEIASLVWQARFFIISAAAVAGVGAIDKLLIGEIFSTADLGIYFFFATCASLVTLVASFTVGATLGPRCIKIFTKEGRDAYLPHHRKLKRMYLLITLAASLLIVLPADFLLGFFGKEIYQRHVEILFLSTASAALVVLCEPYKMNAYLERRDLALVIGNIFHLLAMAACIMLFSLKGEIVWVSVGVLMSSLLTFVYFKFNIGGRLMDIYGRKKRLAMAP